VSISEIVIEQITGLISAGGYAGVAFLMTLESMVAPVPSEAVMPFAGFLIYEGRFTFAGVIVSSTLGSIIGSLISYYAGAWGGRPVVRRFGRYLLLNPHHLESTERFFSRYGDRTIFISRFIPVVRHLISIPAGVGRMNLARFCIYTVIGAGLWNAFLTYVGYYLKENWAEVRKYGEFADIAILAVLVIIIIVIIYRYRQHRANRA
jgi:membrane protein DedA with SNARE-associated domain